MRKLISLLLVGWICLGAACGVWADDRSTGDDQKLVSESVEYYRDGSMLVISVFEEPVLSRSYIISWVEKFTNTVMLTELFFGLSQSQVNSVFWRVPV